MELIVYIWAGLIVLFLVVEAACPIHLVSIWFAAGSLAALIAAMLHAELWLQITLFLVVSVALLIGLWPFTKRFLNPAVKKTNIDAIIGTEGYVTEAIDNLEAQGQVKLGGMPWTARSTTGENIGVHTKVRVDRIEGVKVFVTPAEVPVK